MGPNPPPTPPDPVLPPWVPPHQPPNPSGGGTNDLSNTISERTLTISAWGSYVPVIFGRDIVGGQITLWHIAGGFLYLRLVWCIGECQEIESVAFEDGSIPDGTTFTHYLGTSSQTADPVLSALISGYSDTMRDVGTDDLSLCYSVIKCTIANLESFPKFMATIKGLKMKSPVPTIKSSEITASDEEIRKGYSFLITDNSSDGAMTHTVKFEESELINSEEYSFIFEVTAISGIGAGTAVVEWCDVAVVDTNTATQIDLNALGRFSGVSTYGTFSASKNHIGVIVSGANSGVSIAYNITIFNSLGNGVLKYSNIAGVALNHLLTDTKIGLGLTTDLSTYVAMIDRNNEVLTHQELSVDVYSESRSLIGKTLTRKNSIVNYIELLRGYARCMLDNRGGVIHYNVLKATPVSFTLTVSEMKEFRPFIKKSGDVPNLIRVYYTDTYTTPWKDNYVEIETAEVTSGAEYKREAVYKMDGFQTRPSAKRYAFDRINERLRLFGVKFKAHESVYDRYEGDTFTMSHPILGGSTFKMKIMSKVKTKPSEWQIIAELDDDSIYSNEIADYDPNSGLSTIPNPYTLIDATNLVISIDLPKYQNGVYFSTMICTWTPTTYQYNFFYRLELFNSATGVLVETKILDKSTVTGSFNNVQENVLYRIDLKIITFGTNVSTGISATYLPLGKDFPPTDVSGFGGYEANGLVTLKWADATDNQEIAHYYIQYGTAGFTWNDNESKILQTRLDAKELITNNVLVGTWDFLIKAVDNAGNVSVNATRLAGITVHLNSSFDSNTFGVFSRRITGLTYGKTDSIIEHKEIYGLSLEVEDYTGALIEIKKDDDTNALDVYPLANGRLDEASITAHIGADTYEVSIIYGQKEFADATAVFGKRADIAIAGVIQKDNGVPAMVFTGSQFYNATLPYSTSTDPLTLVAVASQSNITTTSAVILGQNSFLKGAVLITNASGKILPTAYRSSGSYQSLGGTSISNNETFMISATFNRSGNITSYLNGEPDGLIADSNADLVNSTLFQIGAWGAGFTALNGKFQYASIIQGDGGAKQREIFRVLNETYNIKGSGNVTLSEGIVPILSGRTTRNELTLDTLAEVDWLTNPNETFTALFPNGLDTYTEPLMEYGAGIANVLYSEIKDFGADFEGIFTMDTGADEYWINTDEALTTGGEIIESLSTANPVTKVMQLSASASPTTWIDYSNFSAPTTARYMRLKITSPNLTSRWRLNQGALKYRLLKTIQVQDYSGTTTSGTLTITLNESTSDIRLMTVNVNSVVGDYAIIAKVGASPWSSVQVTVYDSTGTIDTTARDVSGQIKYI